ncbi:MAG: hypothetical protein ACW97P_09415 [Candidatus Hodarchaeales archaeon]|jgi:hypothetical protein
MSLDVNLLALRETSVFDYNITHNLGEMADEAGLYKVLWRPEELHITTAGQAISLLRDGLDLLLEEPEHFKQFNPANGWGDYEGLVKFVTLYLKACKDNPDAKISVWR